MSASERDGFQKLCLRNMPTVQDRQMLAERLRSLMATFKHHDRKEIAILIMEMLATYDVAQIKQMTAHERRLAATLYVQELHGVPTWAIAEACSKIRLGTAPDISHSFKPTPIQVRVLAVSIAQPFKQEALLIGEILSAPQYVEGPSEEERDRVRIKMRTFAQELKDGLLGDDGLRDKLAEIEKENYEATLQRTADNSRDAIKKEWVAWGVEPPAGELLVSRSLVKQIEERKKDPVQPPQEKMVL